MTISKDVHDMTLAQSIGRDRLGIAAVHPIVDHGAFPARAVVGETIQFAATVFREGHDKVAATVVLRPPAIKNERRRTKADIRVRMSPGAPGTDRWHATAIADREGAWTFSIEAWSDPIGTWHHAMEAKLEAGQGVEDLANDLAQGAKLITASSRLAPVPHRPLLIAAARALKDRKLDLSHRVAAAMSAPVLEMLDTYPVRELITTSGPHQLWIDRARANFGSWYEFFPRSTGGVDKDGKAVHGTFRTSIDMLPRIAEMGFDVVYLPPIHPVGEVNRKGPNNSLLAGPDDVGSPWAIGSIDGGHDAVHPQLGTMEDFDAFVAAATEHGLEVALDFALQCAPDHPWVKTNPEWFTTLADGTIAYAENPPKKYQDIYPVNFDNDPPGIYQESYRVVKLWVDHGVKIFRVDNPHTKPVNFWNWLIWQIKKTNPEVLFLAEAFTRPAMMKGLAMRGFTQSYTYFTWRTDKAEVEEFGRDLAASAHYFNANLFVNTPDILHASLQYGGRPMFKIRAALAATMAGSWGVYSGFELYEHVAVKPGSEEYLNSEKYQLRPRDFALARAEHRSLDGYIGLLNRIRRNHPALQSSASGLYFHQTNNDSIVAFSRMDPVSGDAVLTVCTLDSYNRQGGVIDLTMSALGLDDFERFAAYDELSGQTFDWGQFNYVELDPHVEPAHVISIRRYTP